MGTTWNTVRPSIQSLRAMAVDEDQFAGVRRLGLDEHMCRHVSKFPVEDATAVLNPFHVVKLGIQAVDEVRRRVQQEIHGHCGRKNDPLYRIL